MPYCQLADDKQVDAESDSSLRAPEVGELTQLGCHGSTSSTRGVLFHHRSESCFNHIQRSLSLAVYVYPSVATLAQVFIYLNGYSVLQATTKRGSSITIAVVSRESVLPTVVPTELKVRLVQNNTTGK